MGGRTLDFPLHDPALQFFFVPNVLIEMQAHTNSFIVLSNGLKPTIGFYGLCVHEPESLPYSLTRNYVTFVLPTWLVNLTITQGPGRLGPAATGTVDAQVGYAMARAQARHAAGPAPDARHQPPGKTIYIYIVQLLPS